MFFDICLLFSENSRDFHIRFKMYLIFVYHFLMHLLFLKDQYFDNVIIMLTF